MYRNGFHRNSFIFYIFLADRKSCVWWTSTFVITVDFITPTHVPSWFIVWQKFALERGIEISEAHETGKTWSFLQHFTYGCVFVSLCVLYGLMNESINVIESKWWRWRKIILYLARNLPSFSALLEFDDGLDFLKQCKLYSRANQSRNVMKFLSTDSIIDIERYISHLFTQVFIMNECYCHLFCINGCTY